jgi:tetratricopeptide (TPR) repeat protein
MDVKQQIKMLIQEAEIYRSQGLLVEAKGKYKQVASVIEKNEQIKNKQGLLDGLNKKIKTLEVDLNKFVKAPEAVQVPKEVQDLIKKQFAFATDKDEDTAALDGAIALAKFGQIDRALEEFNQLIGKESVKVAAAKNILRCHMVHTSMEKAVAQYENWYSSDIFTSVQKNNICRFLEDALNKKGSELTISRVEEIPSLEEDVTALDLDAEDEEIIDISSVTISFEDGPRKGNTIELDVNFQSGNVISLLFSRNEKKLVDDFRVGLKLKNLQFFSPIAIFTGSGIVTEKTKISSGPRQGDYSLDIKIESTN